MYNLYMRKDGFTVISEVCSFYRKLLLVTWPCLHATRLRVFVEVLEDLVPPAAPFNFK